MNRGFWTVRLVSWHWLWEWSEIQKQLEWLYSLRLLHLWAREKTWEELLFKNDCHQNRHPFLSFSWKPYFNQSIVATSTFISWEDWFIFTSDLYNALNSKNRVWKGLHILYNPTYSFIMKASLWRQTFFINKNLNSQELKSDGLDTYVKNLKYLPIVLKYWTYLHKISSAQTCWAKVSNWSCGWGIKTIPWLVLNGYLSRRIIIFSGAGFWPVISGQVSVCMRCLVLGREAWVLRDNFYLVRIKARTAIRWRWSYIVTRRQVFRIE